MTTQYARGWGDGPGQNPRGNPTLRGHTPGTSAVGLSWAELGLGPKAFDWHEQAACRESDPDLFHPEPGVNPHEAKRICAACPVLAQCRAYAFHIGEEHGVWGGLSADERRQQYPRHPRATGGRHDHTIARLTRTGHSLTEIATALDLTPQTISRARARIRTQQEAAS